MNHTPEGNESPAAYIERQLAIGRACYEAAVTFLEMGWTPVPVCNAHHFGHRDHAKRCRSAGKAVLVSWAGFQNRKPTRDEIDFWWRCWPQANVGILLGRASGMVGVDIDSVAAEAFLAELARLHGGVVPETLEFDTPRPGKRLLFALPDGLELASVKFEAEGGELKLMGDGSMSVAPPSQHANGGFYRWREGHGPRAGA
jgi:hypothetical protein